MGPTSHTSWHKIDRLCACIRTIPTFPSYVLCFLFVSSYRPGDQSCINIGPLVLVYRPLRDSGLKRPLQMITKNGPGPVTDYLSDSSASSELHSIVGFLAQKSSMMTVNIGYYNRSTIPALYISYTIARPRSTRRLRPPWPGSRPTPWPWPWPGPCPRRHRCGPRQR
jgi:hypothetical protein